MSQPRLQAKDQTSTNVAGFWPYRDAQRRPTARTDDSHSGWSAALLLVADVP
jgi:hypothetical protein